MNSNAALWFWIGSTSATLAFAGIEARASEDGWYHHPVIAIPLWCAVLIVPALVFASCLARVPKLKKIVVPEYFVSYLALGVAYALLAGGVFALISKEWMALIAFPVLPVAMGWMIKPRRRNEN